MVLTPQSIFKLESPIGNQMTIKKIIHKKFDSVDSETPVSKVKPMFKAGTHAVIVEKDGEYIGVLTERLVKRAMLNPDQVNSGSLVRNVPKLSEDSTIPETARLMIENRIRQLPVLEEGNVIGIVSAKDILKKITEDTGKTPVSQYLTEKIHTTSSEATIAEIMNEFRENDISRMPVVEENSLVGVITMHDIVERALQPVKRPDLGHVMDEESGFMELKIESMISRPAVTADEDDPISSVIQKMIDKNIGSVVITRDFPKSPSTLMGIVTIRDLLEAAAQQLPAKKEPLIQVSSKHDLDRRAVADLIREYVKERPELLDRSTFNVYLDKHKETFRGKHKIFASVRVYTPAGRYIAREDGWGEENAVKSALYQIRRQIDKRLDLKNMFREKRFWQKDIIDM